MVENVSVNKAILSVCEGGINSKSNVVRTQVAMLIDHVISSIGPERFYGSSKDTQVSLFSFQKVRFFQFLFTDKRVYKWHQNVVRWLLGGPDSRQTYVWRSGPARQLRASPQRDRSGSRDPEHPEKPWCNHEPNVIGFDRCQMII